MVGGIRGRVWWWWKGGSRGGVGWNGNGSFFWFEWVLEPGLEESCASFFGSSNFIL